MPNGVTRPAYVGVSLQPGRCNAVVVQDGDIRPVRRGVGDLDELLDEIVSLVAGGPKAVKAVTLDISPLLLDALLCASSDLPRVAAVRVVPRPAEDPVLARSPSSLVERLVEWRYTVPGGHDLLGNELFPLDRAALAAVCAELRRNEVRCVAVVAAGSQSQSIHERDVADAVQAAVPDARIAVASEYGGQGLIAREATVILDSALAMLTDSLLIRCERVIGETFRNAAVRVARGDGGSCTPFYVRALPVVALGAADALQLCGAALAAGREDCRVLLRGPSGPVAGEVRRGLAVVRSGELSAVGTELIVPTAVLAPDSGRWFEAPSRLIADAAVVRPDRDATELACVGAAVSPPTSWLDEVAFIESAVELERVRLDIEQRATAIVMANGAAPGTSYVAEQSAVAVPYSPSGTVRIRIRVAAAGDHDAERVLQDDGVAD